ncbi:MAG: hypothetical protein JXK07_13620 [Spirochaetes bacterium]|nr:hypothetical protein [Spirochaetota bacterium]MBN2771916.1 hypothetical protein [Spirochaetota bacterium]
MIKIFKKICDTKPILLMLCLFTASSLFAEQYQYKTSVKGDVFTTTINIEKLPGSDKYLLSSLDKMTGKSHQITLNSGYESIQWVIKNTNGETITFNRDNNIVKVIGIHAGEHIAKSIKIDEAPWFASLDFGIQAFCKSGKAEISFWVIDPSNLKPHLMTLTRMNEETVSHADKKTQTVKIRITASGVPAIFFNMNYWTRTTDGLPVRSETKQGGPLSPTILNELIIND